MNVDDHLRAFAEHREAIFDWAVGVKGIQNSQRIIGLHASRGIIELLSAFLHEKEMITSGAQLNHRWFKSKKSAEKLPEFPQKESIASKLVELELLCEDLAYGKQKPSVDIEKAVRIFKELEEGINRMRSHDEKE
ncbi:hypothetical protein HYU14_05250 [Candidatus Woesearchaeota archaeon]|nr:hypothetical protein [Candidatus Woesearchaeota archaeon]